MDAVEAGRELDSLIQEKVMGAYFPEDRCRVCGWKLATDIEGGCTKESCSLRPAPSRRADDPPHYSTRLDAAFIVIKHIQREHGFRFDLLGHEKGYWHARFFGHPDPEQNSGQHWGDVYASTPSLAICGAALQSVGKHQEA